MSENFKNKIEKNFDLKSDANSVFLVTNKRCLLLDGSGCNTVKSFLKCSIHKRTKNDIVVPNYCTSTYEKIKSENVCTPFLGSVRAWLDNYCLNDKKVTFSEKEKISNSTGVANCRVAVDTNEGTNKAELGNEDYERSVLKKSKCRGDDDNKPNSNSKFGLIYLDYCCRLNAGYKSIEKSPIKDIECLFEYGVFDDDNNNNNDVNENNNKDNEDETDNSAGNYISNLGNSPFSVSILAVCLCNTESNGNEIRENETHEISENATSSITKKRKFSLLPGADINDQEKNKSNSIQNENESELLNRVNIYEDEESVVSIIKSGKEKKYEDLRRIVFNAADRFGYFVESHTKR